MSAKPRVRKFVALLRNTTDPRDDESVEIKGCRTEQEAWQAAYLLPDVVSRRFSVRMVLTAKEARKNWA